MYEMIAFDQLSSTEKKYMTGKLKYSRLLRYFYIFPKLNLTPKNACFVNVILLQDCMWRYVKGGQGMWLIKKHV